MLSRPATRVIMLESRRLGHYPRKVETLRNELKQYEDKLQLKEAIEI